MSKISLGEILVIEYDPIHRTAKVINVRVGKDEDLVGRNIVYADIRQTTHYMQNNYPEWWNKLSIRIKSRTGKINN